MPTPLETILQLQGLQQKGSLEQLIRALIVFAQQAQRAQPTAPVAAQSAPSNLLSNVLSSPPVSAPSAPDTPRGVNIGSAIKDIGGLGVQFGAQNLLGSLLGRGTSTVAQGVGAIPQLPGTIPSLGLIAQKFAGPVGLGISGALNLKDIFSGNVASGGAGLGGMALGAGLGSLTPLGPIGGAAVGGTVGKLFKGLFGGGKKGPSQSERAGVQMRGFATQNMGARIGEINQAIGAIRGSLESGDVNNADLLRQLGRATSQSRLAHASAEGLAAVGGGTGAMQSLSKFPDTESVLKAIAPDITTDTLRDFLNTGRTGTREEQRSAAFAAAGPKPQSPIASQFNRKGERVPIGSTISQGRRMETPPPVNKLAIEDYQRRLSKWNSLLNRHLGAENLYDVGTQALDLIDSGKFEEGKKLFSDAYLEFTRGTPAAGEGLAENFGVVHTILKNMNLPSSMEAA